MDMITTVLQQRAQKNPQQKAALYLHDGEQETACLTYSELDEKANNIATWLQDNEMAGCRILLLYPAGLDFMSSLLGCWYAGAIAVPVSCPKKDEFAAHQALLNSIAEDADISAIFTLDTLRLTVKSHLTKSVQVLATDKLKKNKTRHYRPTSIDEDTIAYLQYTSGSTSTPKAAVITHGNLRHSLKETLKIWHYTKNSITLNWAPHTHVYGLVCGILMPLYHGTLTIIIPAAAVIKKPLVWLSAISKYRVTHSGCPNFGYDLCLRNIEEESLASLQLQHWKVAVNGGDIVQPQTLMAFSKKFRVCGFKLRQFCAAYGMSELSGAIATTPLKHEPVIYTLHTENQQRVSSGHLLPGLHAITVDPETGIPVAIGEIGEIYLSGKSLVSGYWRRPTETNEVFNIAVPGHSLTYFRTGDLGCIHNDEIYLTGRLKEVMVIYGKKYYPLDLEITVAQSLKVMGIKLPQVVFSSEMANREVVTVIQELTENPDQTQYDLITDTIRHAITKVHGVNIYQVVFIPAGTLPKTTSGKLQRKKCQLSFEQHQLTCFNRDNKINAVQSHLHEGEMNQFIDLVANVLKLDKNKIDIQAPLSRYAFDSINIIHLTTLLNETYQLSISPTALYEYATLSEFYSHRLGKNTSPTAIEKTEQPLNQTNDIAIIGISGLFPEAPDLDTFWDNLVEGKNCITEVPSSRWNWHDLTIQWGGFIDGLDKFDADFFNISPREAALIDPQQRLFLQTVWKSIEDAGYTKSTLAQLKTGLFVGVFNHDYAELLQRNEVMDAYLTTSTLHSMIANRISYFFDFNGPSEAIDTACSSSLVAIHHAVRAIQQGDCELAIAGGVNALITPTAFISARKAGMLSEDGLCKTFDEQANGYVRSEGVGALLLKKLSRALADDDSIYGVIKGTAINHGGHVSSLTAPNPNAQADVIMSACRRAHVPINTIQFIETHGTGTPLGDPIEINGLKKAFQQLALEQDLPSMPKQYCGLGAVKTNIGHLESAAGIAGVIKLLLALKHESMPANIHLNQLNPYIQLEDSPFYVVNQSTSWPKIAGGTPRRAGISSFGFGGANAHVILEESPKSNPPDCQENVATHPHHQSYIIPISAMTASALQQRMADLLTWLKRQNKAPCLAAISYTLAVGREHFSHRFAMIAKTVSELEQQLSNVLSQNPSVLDTSTENPLYDSYLLGNTIDWQQYYGEFQEKIALPSYPFAQASHWIEINQKSKSNLHTLIDDNISTQNTIRFRKQFSGYEFYLDEHQINDESVLPGVVCIEMARAAMELSSIARPVAAIDNIMWQKTMKKIDLINPVHVILIPGDHSVVFLITDHTESTEFVKGEFQYSKDIISPDGTMLDIQTLKSSLLHRQTTEEIYNYFKQAGIVYGPHFQVIQDLQFNDTQVLAELALAASLLTDSNEFILHPCLFDGILQTTQALLKQRETLYIPLSIQHMKQYAALPRTCFVYVHEVSQGNQQNLVNCNIQVLDHAGALVLNIDGFTLRAIAKKPNNSQTTLQYYQPVWIEKAPNHHPLDTHASVLILGHCEKTIHAMQTQFARNNVTCQLIHNLEDEASIIASLADYIIVVLDPLTANDIADPILQRSLEKTYYLAYAIARNVIALKPQHRTQIIFVSQTPSIFSRALVGLCKTLPLEQLNIICRYLELPNLSVLQHEITQSEIDVRYDVQNRRFVPRYQVITDAPASSLPPILKKNGIYLITGGLGGLGYLFAKYLAEDYQAKLVLVGRSPLSEQHQQLLNSLKKNKAAAVYIQADVSSFEGVQELIHQTKKKFGKINGIIHAAGVTQDGLIINKTIDHMKTVAAPKINGTCYLHLATSNEPLDFFVLFSSIAATFGNAGQSDYAYANCFLDEFASMREQQQLQGHCSGRTLSINWPLWQEGGLTIAPEYQQWLEQTMGIVSLTTQQGLQAFSQLLQHNGSNGVVLPGNQSLLVKTLNNRLSINQPTNEKSSADNQSLHEHTNHFLKQLLADTTQRAADSIDEHIALEQYGIDSLMIIDLNQRLSKIVKGLPQTLFFEYQTLSALTHYFVENWANELGQYFSGAIVTQTAVNDFTLTSTPSQVVNIKTECMGAVDIAIIGIDGRYPQSTDLTEFWNNLVSGKDCITEIPNNRWNWKDLFDANKDTTNKIYSKWGGFLADHDQFDPLFFNISPREASLMDPQERLFLETAWKTIENAGYPREQLAGKNIGVYVGVMYSEYQLFGNEGSDSSFVPTHSMFSSIANRVSYWFDFHGPSMALDTMCSSSLTAIHLACQSIRDGECSLALAGGVNLSLHQNKYLLLSHGKFLSSDGHCRSFGEGGDGYVPGEGVGAVLLKPLSQAIKDNDYIYAVIKGSQINHGGKTNGYTVPNPNAQAQLIADTYQKANISPSMVSYIEAHGTGTSLGDPIEIAGLNKIFMQAGRKDNCALGSIKSNIGHCESAAGIAAVSKVVLQLQHRMLVPSLMSESLNPNINWESTPFTLQQTASEWKTPDILIDGQLQSGSRIAGISSFGAGGSNAHLILSEAPNRVLSPITNKSSYLLTLSAKTEIALQQRLHDLLNWITQNPSANIEQVSYTLNCGRSHFDHRCAMVVDSIEETARLLQQLDAPSRVDNIFFQGELNKESSLPPNDPRTRLYEEARAYIAGKAIDWDRLHANESKQKIPLPTYPFAKEQYWYTSVDDTNHDQAIELPRQKITLLDQVCSFLMQQVIQILKLTNHTVSAEKSLGEYGMDSVHFIELSKSIAAHYNIEFTPAVWNTYNDLTAISQYLVNQYPREIGRVHDLANQNQSIQTPQISMRSEPVAWDIADRASSIRIHHSDQIDAPTQIAENSKVRDQHPIDTIDDIAIIGMHGLFPQSDDLATFWQQMIDGKDFVTEIPSARWDWRDNFGDSTQQTDKTNSKWGSFINQIDHFDAGFFNLSAREANLMDPQHRLFLETVWKTIEDAGYNPFELSSQNVGVFAGIEFNEYQSLIAKQQKDFHGFIASGNAPSMLVNRISYFFNFHGPSEAVDTACSSSLVAIHRAVQALRQQECKIAVAGGVSIILNPDTYVITSQLGALSPDGRCKTFDQSANGYVKGEGIAALLLKPLHQAQLDGDSIYGVIKASAVNHGGRAQSLTAPNASAQSDLLIKAYTQAGIDPKTLTLIETHGTGTMLGDPVEIEGLKLAFKTLLGSSYSTTRIALSSVKSNIGHLEAASGIAGVIKVLLSMAHETIPSILHFQQLNPYIHLANTPFYIANLKQPWQRLKTEQGHDIPLRAGVSSFGFGGTNAHIVLEEGRAHQSAKPLLSTKPYYLFTFSAKQKSSLQQKILDLQQWLSTHQNSVSLPSLSFTLNVGRAHFEYRCALVANSTTELLRALTMLAAQTTPEYCIMNDGQACHMHGPVFDSVYQQALRALQQPDNHEQYRYQLFILADLYTKHYQINWDDLFTGEKYQRIGSLPSYPFIKQRYWFDVEFNSVVPAQVTDITDQKINAHNPTSVISYLQTIFAKALHIPAESIQPDKTYEIYGVDSVMGLEITNRLANVFGKIPKTLLYERRCLTDLANYFIKHHQNTVNMLVSNVQDTSYESAVTEVCPANPPPFDGTASNDIAIIGLSGTFPMANTMDEFWKNLTSGRNCISKVPKDRWNYKDYPVDNGDKINDYPYGGFIPDVDKFDPLFFNISARDAALMDPQERLFMQSAWSTLEDGGYNREKLKSLTNNSVGVFVGASFNYYPLFIAEEWQKDNLIPLDIQSFSIANRISYFLNLNGPSFVIDTACSSSLAAIHLACESLLNGGCAMAIAGGVNLSLHPSKYHFLGSFGFMSSQGRCASFSEGGDGYVPAEGVGAVLLKPLANAIHDKDTIYGVIKGSSMNHGGKTSGYTVPNPDAQSAVILKALQQAHIDPRTISYVEAHGTGTSLGDPIEIRGLQEAYATYTEDKQYCAIGSVKSNIGHLEAAAGISQIAKVLLQLRHRQLVPTLHTENLNSFIDFEQSPFYVQRELQAWKTENNAPRRAGISSFGAGGTNVHMIIEEYIAETTQKTYPDDEPLLWVLSAFNEERLTEYVAKMTAYLQENQHINDPAWLRDACYTLQVGRESMTARLAVLASNKESLLAALLSYPQALTQHSWINPHCPNARDTSLEESAYLEPRRYEDVIHHWINGGLVSWEKLYRRPMPRIVSLPTYPFAKRRCWITEKAVEHTTQPILLPTQAHRETLAAKDWLYSIEWVKNQGAAHVNTKEHYGSGQWLIISDLELGFVLQDELGTNACIYCFAGESFSKHNEQVYYINPLQSADYIELFGEIHAQHREQLKGIIYLCSQNRANEKEPDPSIALFHCFKGMLNDVWPHPLTFCLVSHAAHHVNAQDQIDIWQHHLWSMTRIFSTEQTNVHALLLDLDPQDSLRQNAQIIAHELATYQTTQNHIAYRANERYTLRFLPEIPSQHTIDATTWRTPSAVLITGGLGSLGYEVAKFIIAEGCRFVLLTGATPLSSQTHEKNSWLQQLKSKGVEVKYAAIDVVNAEAMQNLIQETETAWQQPIDGVFHLAGITTDNIPIANLDEALWRKVLDVKIKGALVLHELFKQSRLSCFVLFSSIAAVPHFGIAGLSAYAVANEFLNGLAWYRRNLQLPAISINWVAWSEKGMSHQHQHDAFLHAVGMASLKVQQGISILKYLLQSNPTEITVCNIDWNKFLRINPTARQHDFFTYLIDENTVDAVPTPAIVHTEDYIQDIVQTTFANVLAFDLNEIDGNTPMTQYGMDSVAGITFVSELGKYFPDGISPMDLYRYPTLKQLTDYLKQPSPLVRSPEPATSNDNELNLDALNLDQLQAMMDAELNELELTYD